MLALRIRLPVRLPLSTSIALSLISQMLWWASPAEAQGFFQQLFGLSPAPQSYVKPRATAPRAPLAGTPMPLVIVDPPAYRPGRSVPPEGSGSYTTMCVRMCDGFYFPVSHRVPRSRFHRDADICRARCPNSETRLFYHSSSSGNMKDAVDLTGRAYSRLPIAFQHRKRLVSGCGCKPEPWSVEAAIRHEGYALAEGTVVPGRSLSGGTLTVVAGNYPDTVIIPPSEQPADAAASADGGAGDGATTTAASLEPAAGTSDARASDARATNASARSRAEPSGRGSQRPRPSRVSQRKSAANPAVARASAATRKGSRLASASSASGGGSKLVWPGDAPTRMR